MSLNNAVCLTLTALLTGIALQFAMPPFSSGWLVYVGFVPVLLCLHFQTKRVAWALSGFCVGISWAALSPFALAGWGGVLIAVPWLLSASVTAGIFLLASVVFLALPMMCRWLALPASWSIAWVFAELSGIPILSPAAALSLWSPDLLGSARLIGAPGIDFLILSINAVLAQLLIHARKQPASNLMLLALLAILSWLGTIMPIPSPSGHVDLSAIQPAFSPSDLSAQKWSLPQRLSNESRIDTLLERAARNSNTLILVPEGGNDLFNTRLPQRRSYLENLMADSNAELLMSGKDLTPSGQLRNIVSHITRDGFQGDIAKAHPAPFAEANILPGTPDVLHTNQGAVGVSICYDSVFSRQWRRQVQKGAEFAVVVTDDSSFGISGLAQWHLAYSILHAIEAGRALAYLSNFGPSVVTDIGGTILPNADWSGQQQAISRWRVEKTAQLTLATRGGHYSFVVISAAIVFFALLSASRKGNFFAPPRTADAKQLWLYATIPFVATVSMAIYGWSLAVAGKLSGSDILHALVYQINRGGVIDGLAPAFTQSSVNSCGAAAIGFLLTQLGDTVFEHDVERAMTPASTEGYSLQELAQFATSRGFTATGVKGEAAILTKKIVVPFLAHMSNSHYVVVLYFNEDSVVFFDPAMGKTMNTTRSGFLQQWSGKALLLSTRSFEKT